VQKLIANSDHKNVLRGQTGSSLILLILVTAIAMFIGQMEILQRQMELNKETSAAAAQESRYHLVSFLDNSLGQEMALRNSRYSINALLKQCLTGKPTPCDERQSYDMVLVSPTPPLVFQGGAWPDIPAGVPFLAGGLATNKLFFTPSGGRCPSPGLTNPTPGCPLQAIIQFKPVCGGTVNGPELTVAGGGPCASGATGFDITVGVGKLYGTELVYHQKTSSGGDAKVYRFSSLILKY
jgi:hypothetical protein